MIKNSHNQVGVLSVDVSYESIQDILSDFTVGRTGNITLVSESGIIVTSKNTKQIGKNIKEEEVFQKIKEAKDPNGKVGLGDSNKVNDVLYDKSADSNVWAYSEVKASDLDKELGALVRTTIIVTILMLLFVGLVSYAAIKIVAAIIDCFNHYFRKVGEGKLEKMSQSKRVKGEKWTWDQLARRVVYPDKTGNEIQQMADNYNVMIEGTGALIQKVQKKVVVSQKCPILYWNFQNKPILRQKKSLKPSRVLQKLPVHKLRKQNIVCRKCKILRK